MNTRALGGAVLAGAGLSLVLCGAYLAGGAARTAAAKSAAAQVAAAGPEAEASPAQGHAMAPTPAALRGPAPAPAAASAARFAHSPAAVDCLTDAVYYEARGESTRGQEAVAQVVLNRVRSHRFPGSVCGVVFQGVAEHSCQFSFACNGAMHETREAVAWRRARSVAERALDGFVMEEVADATNFHVARLGQIWGSGLVKVAQVGEHVFYKLTRHGTFVAHAPPDRHGDGDDGDDGAPADGGGQPSLILASAVTTKALGQGGPVGPVPPPASAPQLLPPAPAKTDAVKAAAKAPEARLPAPPPAPP